MNERYKEFYDYFVKLIEKHLAEAEEKRDIETQVKLLKVYIELQKLLTS